MIWAAADAPSPAPGTQIGGHIIQGANGAVTVVVDSGNWVWGNTHTCSSTGRSDRFAAGYAVDWQDPSAPGTPIGSSGVDVGTPTDQHVYYNAEEPCGHPATVPWKGNMVQGTAGSIAPYDLATGATPSRWVGTGADLTTPRPLAHTYTNGLPQQPICVVTFDIHGAYPTSAKELTPAEADDNSILTNRDIPVVSQRCFPLDLPEAPDLAIHKSVNPSSVQVGGTFTYALTLDNVSSKTAATGTTTVIDTLPAGLSFSQVKSVGNGWQCGNSSSTVTCTTMNSIAAGARGVTVASIDAVALASAIPAGATSGTVVNPATVSNPNDTNTDNNRATATSTVTQAANPQLDLAILKSASAASAKVGDLLDYTLAVRNASNENTTGTVTVTDSIPAGLQVQSAPTGSGWDCTSSSGQSVICTRPSLAKGAAAPDITVRTKVLASAIPAGASSAFVVNTGIVDTPGDVNSDNNRSTVTTPVTPVAPPALDLAIQKSASVSTGKVGERLDYTLNVTNVSNADTTGTVTVTDTVSSKLQLLSADGDGWTCSIGGGQAITCTRAALAHGTSASITVRTIALAAAVPSVSNTGVVSTPGDNNPNNNQSTVTTPVSPAANLDLAIVKVASAASAKLGDTLTYSLYVTNASNADTTGAVTVTDTVPAGLHFESVSGTGWSCSTGANQAISCTRSSLAAGVTAPVITVTTTVLAAGAPQVVNTGIVSTPGDNNPNNDQSTVTTPVSVPAPKLAIVKSAVPTSGTSVFRSDRIVYTLSYSNDSDTAANGAVITDDVPAGTTLDGSPTCPTPACQSASVNGNTISWTVNVPAHGSGSVSFAAIVNEDVADGAVIRNHAVMSYGGTSITTNETQHPVSVPNGGLSLVKSVDNTAPNFGDLLTYSLVVTAMGNVTQTGVTVTDVVPNDTTYEGPVTCSTGCTGSYNAGTNTVTWDVGTMAPGSSVTVTFATRINTPNVPSGTTVTRTIDNVGMVFSNETPTTPSNHVRTPITAVLGVKIVKTPSTPTATLPFTGVGLPVGRAVTDGVLLVLAGMLMLALASGGRRKPNAA